jgi:uncharacterized membrane protein YsdA (DUF1294 family)
VRRKLKSPSKPRGTGGVSLVCVLLLVLVVGVAVLSKKLPVMVLIIYAGVSLLTFVVYALDKAAARNNRQRTPENTLHLLAVLGGWPGAVFAQRMLRHKSVKPEFRRVFWVTVAINCAVLACLLTAQGTQLLYRLNWHP